MVPLRDLVRAGSDGPARAANVAPEQFLRQFPPAEALEQPCTLPCRRVVASQTVGAARPFCEQLAQITGRYSTRSLAAARDHILARPVEAAPAPPVTLIDVMLPGARCRLPREFEAPAVCNVILGFGDTVANFHFDAASAAAYLHPAWNAPHTRKIWYFVRPERARELDLRRHGASGSDTDATGGIGQDSVGEPPDLRPHRVCDVRVEQRVGDVVYVPVGWMHRVDTLGGRGAVLFTFDVFRAADLRGVLDALAHRVRVARLQGEDPERTRAEAMDDELYSFLREMARRAQFARPWPSAARAGEHRRWLEAFTAHCLPPQ